MIDPGRRRFTLLDGMIVVAASALGLALTRWTFPWLYQPIFVWALVTDPLTRGGSAGAVIGRLTMFLCALAPGVLAGEVGYLALRLRGPRPRWRRLTRQPGIIAAIVVLIAAALGATAQWGWAWLDHRARLLNQGEPYYFMLNAHAMLAQRAGFAVLIAWLTLAISGRWRAGRGRLDRFGRALGVYWIATAILASYFVDRVIWWGSFLDNL